MKKKWQELRAAVLLCIGLGWWGFWYPELEQVADTYAIILEDGTVQRSSEMVECGLGESLWDLRHVDSSRIKVSSRLWKLLQEYLEEDRLENDFWKSW